MSRLCEFLAEAEEASGPSKPVEGGSNPPSEPNIDLPVPRDGSGGPNAAIAGSNPAGETIFSFVDGRGETWYVLDAPSRSLA